MVRDDDVDTRPHFSHHPPIPPTLPLPLSPAPSPPPSPSPQEEGMVVRERERERAGAPGRDEDEMDTPVQPPSGDASSMLLDQPDAPPSVSDLQAKLR